MSSRVNSKTTIAPLNSSATARRGGNWPDARSPDRSSLKSHASFGQSQSWSLEPLLRILSHHMWDKRDKLWRPERPIIARR